MALEICISTSDDSSFYVNVEEARKIYEELKGLFEKPASNIFAQLQDAGCGNISQYTMPYPYKGEVKVTLKDTSPLPEEDWVYKEGCGCVKCKEAEAFNKC